ncbi:MAG: pimeloyl-ACP methyl ester carboxylesterase [Gammaproteobacteria bacterium]
MDHRDERIDVRGKNAQVLVGGSGPPLLYLHSAGGEVAWLPLFDLLSQHFEVFVPAHPGFVYSDGLDEIDSMEDLVLHYTDLIDLLGIVQPALVGLSLGGWTAAEFATRYSDRIGALVLIAPVGVRPPVQDFFPRHRVKHTRSSSVNRNQNSRDSLSRTIQVQKLTNTTLEGAKQPRVLIGILICTTANSKAACIASAYRVSSLQQVQIDSFPSRIAAYTRRA